MHHKLFVPAQGIYLLNHSVGRMPTTTRDGVEQHYFKAWEQGKPDPWSEWMQSFDAFKSALAVLLNGDSHAFCPQTNISSALHNIISALPAPNANKNVILLCEHDFPSAGFALKQAERMGYKVRFLPSDADPQQVDSWSDALSNDVHTVLITQVHFNTSRLIPVQQITEISHKRAIFSIVDTAQSVGIVPIDLNQWQADAVVGSCVKWLCGGSGAGFLWINPERIEQLQPIAVGWFSHQDPFEFDIHHFQYASDSRRFWGGTPSVLPYVVATNSINIIHNIGVEKIRKHNQALNQYIVENIPASDLNTPSVPAKRGGTLVINPNNIERAEQALLAAGVAFDRRALGLRLSPHIYNTQDEMETVLDCLLKK